MRSIRAMETVQVEITNACIRQCSNCTRLVGHFEKPYFMPFDQFTAAVNSLVDYADQSGQRAHLIGVMGGEPLLHPEFEKFCEYLRSKVAWEKTGLWSAFPPGKEHLADIVAQTFGNIFLNDHSRDDVLHQPVLVGASEICQDPDDMWTAIDDCWVNKFWSAAVNPNGAYFCEVAAAMGMLLGIKGWEVEPGWWKKAPIDYHDQMRIFCYMCGAAFPLKKRASVEGIDDVSPKWVERLKRISPKVNDGKYQVHDLQIFEDKRPTATYKDIDWRKKIAARYDLGLVLNDKFFLSPYVKTIERRRKKELEEKQRGLGS